MQLSGRERAARAKALVSQVPARTRELLARRLEAIDRARYELDLMLGDVTGNASQQHTDVHCYKEHPHLRRGHVGAMGI
jgi:hypothetical protein